MEKLQMISILLELAVMTLGVLIALSKRKIYGWGITLTFAIYVFYDCAKLFAFSLNPHVLSGIFFTATLSILWAVYLLYREL